MGEDTYSINKSNRWCPRRRGVRRGNVELKGWKAAMALGFPLDQFLRASLCDISYTFRAVKDGETEGRGGRRLSSLQHLGFYYSYPSNLFSFRFYSILLIFLALCISSFILFFSFLTGCLSSAFPLELFSAFLLSKRGACCYEHTVPKQESKPHIVRLPNWHSTCQSTLPPNC